MWEGVGRRGKARKGEGRRGKAREGEEMAAEADLMATCDRVKSREDDVGVAGDVGGAQPHVRPPKVAAEGGLDGWLLGGHLALRQREEAREQARELACWRTDRPHLCARLLLELISLASLIEHVC